MSFFWKFIFSTIWLGGFGIGSIAAIIHLGIEGLPFLGGLIFGFLILYYGCLRAKNVYMDDEFLYIGNFLKKINVPLNEVKKVDKKILFTSRPIFIEFKTDTEFGKKIMFIGYTKNFLFSLLTQQLIN